MGQPAGYARRVDRLARMFGILMHHPDGLRLADLAVELGVSVTDLRADLVVFMNRDVPVHLDWALVRGVGLELLGSEGEETESSDAVRVRLTSNAPLAELGLEYLSADVLGPVYRAAIDLAAVEPDNTVLRDALDRLSATLMEGVDSGETYGGPVAAQLRRAVRDRRRVRIVYARVWRPGVGERVIEPYRVVGTRRGFEVDAGPPDDDGSLRTFLVSGIRTLDMMDETFDVPADVDDLIDAARQVVEVRLVVPRERSWVVERFAESVVVTRADDDLEMLAEVLPPVPDRVGLMLTLAGPDAFVVEPAALRHAGADTARALLAHHGLD